MGSGQRGFGATFPGNHMEQRPCVSSAGLLLEIWEASALGSNDLLWLVAEEMLPPLSDELREERCESPGDSGGGAGTHKVEDRCLGVGSFPGRAGPVEARQPPSMAVLFRALEGTYLNS